MKGLRRLTLWRNLGLPGHETFPCRYPWLPKAVNALRDHPDLFKDIDEAIVVLGVGKQMARAIRFWIEAAKVVEKQEKGDFEISKLGEKLLGEDGFDPYLEDIQTLWLIHWNFSTHPESPIFAWDFLMNRWQDPEIAPLRAVAAFKKKQSHRAGNCQWSRSSSTSIFFFILMSQHVEKKGTYLKTISIVR